MRSGETSRSAAFTSGGFPPTVFTGGLTNDPLQPTGIVPPDVCTGISLTRLSLWRLSGRAPGQGSTGAGAALLWPGAAERLVPPTAAPSAFAAVSGTAPNVTEMTAEVLPVALVRNNCTWAPAELRAIICARSSSERTG